MHEWFSGLSSTGQLQLVFGLFVTCFVCWACLLSLSRYGFVGWYRGPLGNPLGFCAILLGALLPPVVFLLIFPSALFIFLASFLTIFFIGNTIRKLFGRRRREIVVQLAGPALQPDDDQSFVGNRETLVYHVRGCEYQLKMSSAKRVIIRSAEEARAKGYTPCRRCFSSNV